MTVALVDEIYVTAKKMGCDPLWHDGILGWRWYCTCQDNEHGFDQQCSVITKNSLLEFERFEKAKR